VDFNSEFFYFQFDLLLSIFRSPHKKNKKIKKSRTLSEENKKIYSSEKRTLGPPENDQRLVEEVQKYKD